MAEQEVRRRWRDYRTRAGRSPVHEFLNGLDEDARAEVIAAMMEVRDDGLGAARHLRDEIYEVRASHNKIEYRVLFATEGQKSRILLSVVAFEKRTRKTPPDQIDLAQSRLNDWRDRGREDPRRSGAPRTTS